LGLIGAEEGDLALAQELLDWMKQAGADFTNTFAALTRSVETGCLGGEVSFAGGDFRGWHEKWEARVRRQQGTRDQAVRVMRGANPVVIARNHRVEEALAAAEAGDLSVMHRLLAVLARPFEETAGNQEYRKGAEPGGEPYRTFCGT
jgi:uncharacterized protein YdiU (UPF0061 family)